MTAAAPAATAVAAPTQARRRPPRLRSSRRRWRSGSSPDSASEASSCSSPASSMIVSVTKPWFTVEGLGTLAWNEGYVWSTGYETFKPSSPISADIGYFAVILGAAGVILGLLNVSDAAPDWEGKLDQAWLRVIGRFFADRGICLLVLAAIIARFATRQDDTEYAIGIYLFLVAAVALTVGSIMAGAEDDCASADGARGRRRELGKGERHGAVQLVRQGAERDPAVLPAVRDTGTGAGGAGGGSRRAGGGSRETAADESAARRRSRGGRRGVARSRLRRVRRGARGRRAVLRRLWRGRSRTTARRRRPRSRDASDAGGRRSRRRPSRPRAPPAAAR